MAALNFSKYCEPVVQGEANERDTRRLWKNIESHLKRAMQTVYLREISSSQWEQLQQDNGEPGQLKGLSAHAHVELPYYSKFLLIAAYLASYNPARTDKRFFVKHHGKIRKKNFQKKHEKTSNHLLGPKPFPLDRLLAILYSIVDSRVAPTANIFSQRLKRNLENYVLSSLETEDTPSHIIIEHVGTDNVEADALSRQMSTTHEWELDRPICDKLFRMWVYPDIDLFATRENRVCKLFCSRAGIGQDSRGDALMINWNNVTFYAFPLIPLLMGVVLKIVQDNATEILITSWWPRQPWFTTLLIQSKGVFHRLPMVPHLLTQHNGEIRHPDLASLKLTVWNIS
ncbi:Origin recognition complex subunit 5 [Varanus komodoensis]|nr:Origin recognition complex subunit 5 [Varanus komodoensis]